MINTEQWKSIDGYEGLYEINNIGNVKNRHSSILSERIKKGYNTCRLSKNGVYKEHSIHRLVASAFIPNPENKPQVNHINGIKSDNRVSNLEWCTISENTKHALDLGLLKIRRGEQVKNSILTEKDVLEIRKNTNVSNLEKKRLSLLYKVSYSTIDDVITRRRWAYL